jgi:hypothetical protein
LKGLLEILSEIDFDRFSKPASTMCESSSMRNAEFSDVKADNPTILTQLGDFIACHCTHGMKTPVAIDLPESGTAHLCCLKCAVDFIFKDRAKNKITIR